jgi:hypothetical protein
LRWTAVFYWLRHGESEVRAGGFILNWDETLLFHSEATPHKTAVMCQGAGLSYAHFVFTVLSLERRIRHAGLQPSQTVAVLIQHPIEHFSMLYALYRLQIASVSISGVPSPRATALACDAVLTDRVIAADAVMGISAPQTILVDRTWYQDPNISAADARRADPADPSLPARLVLPQPNRADPNVIPLSRGDVQSRLVADYLGTSAVGWERAICLADLTSELGFRMALLSTWLGRSICLAHPGNARQLASISKHDFLIAPLDEARVLVDLQERDYVSVDWLRGAYLEGNNFPATLLARFQTLFCNKVICSYAHPTVGPVAYGFANPAITSVEAVGLVAPWVELQIGAENQGIGNGNGRIRIRRPDQASTPSDWGGDRTAENRAWIDTSDMGRLLKGNLLAISSPAMYPNAV